ncbi:interferon regulatory factor 9 [Sorex araneus]|uniref:interferon regulatory factor 9 n=1 Tax=Sorex araneus TaxID=42254 RepID=UPI00243382C9|nr:interferon regulatory factor 9 [Sorex araneus]
MPSTRGRGRSTRKLRNWVVEQVESGKFPGVCWEDAEKTMFRIPWKHAGKQDFREDQDAAFFKAWAIFKGKHKEGEAEGPAIWKTRLRCALNKSPEFEEVPGRNQLDGAEPYKVYRLLPQGTVPDPSETQKTPVKRHHSSVLPDREDEPGVTKSCTLSLPSLPKLLKNEPEAGRIAGGPNASSSSSSSPSSSEPQEGADPADGLLQGEEVPIDLLLSLYSEPCADEEATWTEVLVSQEYLASADFSLFLTFIYAGRVVGEAQVQSLDCRLVAEPSSSHGGMEQVLFPKADPLEPTQNLLKQLERGVMVASNSQGLFVQSLCPIPISWNSPQAPEGPGPHLLPSNEFVGLFRTRNFCRDLDMYLLGLGPEPKFQVTLDFWEESPDTSRATQSLITVQMEQAYARHLLKKKEQKELVAIVS